MKKTVIIVGGDNGIAAALARVLVSTPIIDVDVDLTIRPMETDGENIYYDPAMLDNIRIVHDDRIADNLPKHAKKPTFLLKQNHHIRKVRK